MLPQPFGRTEGRARRAVLQRNEEQSLERVDQGAAGDCRHALRLDITENGARRASVTIPQGQTGGRLDREQLVIQKRGRVPALI
jgi:hypothetical protein